MATYNPDQIISKVAFGDYSASQNRLLVVDTTTSSYVVRASVTTTPILGTLYNTPGTGGDASVVISGIGKVELGARTTANNAITSDSVGRGVPTAVASSFILGYAVTGGVTGDIVDVRIAPAQI
jgi:hypothetical protein